MMKVKQLIAALEDLDPEMEVMVSSDPEGNSFMPLESVDSDKIAIEDGYWGWEMYDVNLDAEDNCLDEEVWEEMKNELPRIVLLWP